MKFFFKKMKKYNIIKSHVLLFLFFLILFPDHASASVILMYHKFGESSFPSTNIRIDQFESHIKELKDKNFNVLPLSKILVAIENKEELPEKTVAITIDDGYKSVYSVAFPALKKANLPFTVFISTNAIDENYKSHMTWNDIRNLASSGVEIGAHTNTHLHMVDHSDDVLTKEIETSNRRFQEELGFVPEIFAYPYGEASIRVKKIVRNHGYKFAFAQHSGAININSDIFFLNRFALNEGFGQLKRFRKIINALPLEVQDVLPRDHVTNRNPPSLGFTVTDKDINIEELNCFPSGNINLEIKIISSKRVEVRFDKPFPRGRTRINCTALGKNNTWHWTGFIFYTKAKGEAS